LVATHEEKSGNNVSRREFKKTVDVPADAQIGLMRSVLSKDGILSVTAPVNPPLYDSGSQVVQQVGQPVDILGERLIRSAD